MPAPVVCVSIDTWDYRILDPENAPQWMETEYIALYKHATFSTTPPHIMPTPNSSTVNVDTYLRAARFFDAFRAWVDASFNADYHKKMAFLTPPVQRLLSTEEALNHFTRKHTSLHSLVWELRALTSFYHRLDVSKRARYKRFTEKSVKHYDTLTHVMRCSLMHELEHAPRFKMIRTAMKASEDDINLEYGERHAQNTEDGYTKDGLWVEIATSPIPEVLVLNP
jgi:hypothetical protein